MDKIASLRRSCLRLGEQIGQRFYCVALGLFVFLTNFFSSNIQSTLPQFSHWMRLGLCAVVGLMLLVKVYLFSPFRPSRYVLVTAGLALSGAISLASGDLWFFASTLLIAAAYQVDLRQALKTFILVAVGSTVLVQLFHLVGLIPFGEYERAFDFGYGHYNGFGGRLFGIYAALFALCFSGLSVGGWVAFGIVPFLVFFLTSSRGAFLSMLFLFLSMLILRLFPCLFEKKPVHIGMVLFGPVLWGFSLYAAFFYDEMSYFWIFFDRIDSLRFSFGHRALVQATISLLGGTPVNTGQFNAVDNAYMAALLNKGILGSILLFVFFVGTVFLLVRLRQYVPALSLCAVLLYGMVENRIFELSDNVFLLWFSILIFSEMRSQLPDLERHPQPKPQ